MINLFHIALISLSIGSLVITFCLPGKFYLNIFKMIRICLPFTLQSTCSKPDMEADTAETQQKDFNSNGMNILLTENMRSSQGGGFMEQKDPGGIIYDFIGFVLFYLFMSI